MTHRQPRPAAPFGLRPPAAPGSASRQDRTGHRGGAPEQFGLEERAPVRVTIEADTWGSAGLVLGALLLLRSRV